MDATDLNTRILQGGPEKYHQKNTASGKWFARERIRRLLDDGSEWIEDGRFVRCLEAEYPSEGIVTGFGRMHGRVVAIVANDSTVKAGSWGKLTVEKILRLQEEAGKLLAPILYLVDSAGARIPEQLAMFPGRRGAGRIFYNQVQLSQKIPQLCIVFGPCAAGGAYIPAFCDVTIMVERNASMYLGSPRMAQVVIREIVDHETMGGTDVHTLHSGCADLAFASETKAVDWMRRWMGLWFHRHGCVDFKKSSDHFSLQDWIPTDPSEGYDIYPVISHILDDCSFLEIKPKYASEMVCGLGTLAGMVVGVVANQPKVKGGVLFCESADKAASFITYCQKYAIPLLFLCDVPGFMIGSAVEKQGIIRYGARMISAVASATVPKISVILRKAYGAGLYAMCGPAFEPDCCLALPSAQIGVMGPEPAIRAVYHNHIEAITDPNAKEAFVAEKIKTYLEDIHIWKLASESVVDHVVDFSQLRSELISRFGIYRQKVGPLP